MTLHPVTAGIAADLIRSARAAGSGMVDLVSRQQRMAPIDAYILCGVCGDLRISAIVDQPNWVVSFYFPKVVFD